jgi:hypothetical protein
MRSSQSYINSFNSYMFYIITEFEFYAVSSIWWIATSMTVAATAAGTRTLGTISKQPVDLRNNPFTLTLAS